MSVYQSTCAQGESLLVDLGAVAARDVTVHALCIVRLEVVAHAALVVRASENAEACEPRSHFALVNGFPVAVKAHRVVARARVRERLHGCAAKASLLRQAKVREEVRVVVCTQGCVAILHLVIGRAL